jgi:hypothetical protein
VNIVLPGTILKGYQPSIPCKSAFDSESTAIVLQFSLNRINCDAVPKHSPDGTANLGTCLILKADGLGPNRNPSPTYPFRKNFRMRSIFLFVFIAFLFGVTPHWLVADGPADNQAENVRPIPPPGIEIALGVIDMLEVRCQEIREQWGQLVQQAPRPEERQRLEALAPEVLVIPRSVEMAIQWGSSITSVKPDGQINYLTRPRDESK